MQEKNKYLLPGIAIGLTAVVGAALLFRCRNKKSYILHTLEPLNKKICEQRRKIISSKHVEYDLTLTFLQNANTYFGTVEINFEIDELADLSLDFQKKGIEFLEINKKKIENPLEFVSADQIMLPKELLTIGSNVVVVEFKNLFDKDKYGLNKHSEHDINSVVCGYLPSMIFPCFDQPDIKCTFKLSLILPKELEAISNEKQAGTNFVENIKHVPQNHQNDYKVVEFMKSKILPVHNICVYAGVYEKVKTKKMWKTTQINFYCRPKYKAKLLKQIEDLEMVIHKTLDYFQTKLESKYPFSKLDIVYAKSSCTAIEYPGAILMNQRFLNERDAYDQTEGYVTLAHEIIHMWFGNITTCDYWDNIFLHESFANYISVLVYETFYKSLKAKVYEPEVYFLLNKTRKSVIYSSQKSSHGVKFEMNEIELANTIFNPTVYNKGECLLDYFHDNWKDAFFLLLARMIKNKSWGNLTYKEFLSYINDKERLKVKELFETTKTNVIEIRPTSKSREFKIEQIENNGFIFENIGITVYDLETKQSSLLSIDLNNNASFEIPSTCGGNFIFVFNHKHKAFCIWKDDLTNHELVLNHVDFLSEVDLINYFMNLYNWSILRKDSPEMLLNFFLRAFDKLQNSNPKSLVKLLAKVYVKKVRNANYSKQILDYFLERDQFDFAIKFLITEEDCHAFYLKVKELKKDGLWKSFVGKINQLSISDKFAEELRPYHAKFDYRGNQSQFDICKPENIDREFMSLIMYRTHHKNLAFYIDLLSFMKVFLPEKVQFNLALKFLNNFESISDMVCKFYIQSILHKVVFCKKYEKFGVLKEAFEKAILSAGHKPLLLNVLKTRLDLVSLYNQ